jgi:hypothetical protein
VIRWNKATISFALALALAACGGERQGGDDMDTSKAQPPPDLGNMTPQVVLETNMGTIVMELDKEKAPKSAESILLHVENGFYDGLMFHRVIPGFMIQAGGFAQRSSPVLYQPGRQRLSRLHFRNHSFARSRGRLGIRRRRARRGRHGRGGRHRSGSDPHRRTDGRRTG